jgi:hypothetical protein
MFSGVSPSTSMHVALLYSEIALSRCLENSSEYDSRTYTLRMADTMTFQNIVLLGWDLLCGLVVRVGQSWFGFDSRRYQIF